MSAGCCSYYALTFRPSLSLYNAVGVARSISSWLMLNDRRWPSLSPSNVFLSDNWGNKTQSNSSGHYWHHSPLSVVYSGRCRWRSQWEMSPVLVQRASSGSTTRQVRSWTERLHNSYYSKHPASREITSRYLWEYLVRLAAQISSCSHINYLVILRCVICVWWS